MNSEFDTEQFKLLQHMFEQLKRTSVRQQVLPIFEPEDNRKFKVSENKRAVNINQSVFSIAVCMYHFITGKSEWNDPSFMLGYPDLDDQIFGRLINKILQQIGDCGLDYLEKKINS